MKMLYKCQVLSYYYRTDLNRAGGPGAAFPTPPPSSPHCRDRAPSGKVCFPGSLAAWETCVLGWPPYRNPLKIPIAVYLVSDTVRPAHELQAEPLCMCPWQEAVALRWQLPAILHFLRLFSSLFPLPFIFLLHLGYAHPFQCS